MTTKQYVEFYGLEASVVEWKALLCLLFPDKYCGPVLKGSSKTICTSIGRRTFKAYITEDDCKKLMALWYHKSPNHDMPWNCRITFKKSWGGCS